MGHCNKCNLWSFNLGPESEKKGTAGCLVCQACFTLDAYFGFQHADQCIATWLILAGLIFLLGMCCCRRCLCGLCGSSNKMEQAKVQVIVREEEYSKIRP